MPAGLYTENNRATRLSGQSRNEILCSERDGETSELDKYTAGGLLMIYAQLDGFLLYKY